jgi:hypothetical protein
MGCVSYPLLFGGVWPDGKGLPQPEVTRPDFRRLFICAYLRSSVAEILI